jgi:hypothetical protein
VLEHRVQVLRRELTSSIRPQLRQTRFACGVTFASKHIALENGSSETRPRSVIVRSVLHTVARLIVGNWRRTDS